MSDHDEPTLATGSQQLMLSRDGVIAETVGAEIDQQISTARAYPRTASRSLAQCQSLATSNRKIAETCRYALKRGGKVIEGPSVRFAEILAHSWGNTRFGARVVGYDRKHLTAQGFFVDLEHNNAVTVDVKRRITDRSGNIFNDDMIAVTAQAASSVALRNAIFAGIPRGLWDHVFREVEKVILGDAKDLQETLHIMYDTLAGMGVSKARVHAACGAEGEEDMSLKRIAFVRSLYQAVMDGDSTLDQNFPEPGKAKPVGSPKEPTLDDLAQQTPPPAKKKAPPKKKQEAKQEDAKPDKSGTEEPATYEKEGSQIFFDVYAKDLKKAKDALELGKISQLAAADKRLSDQQQVALLDIGDQREAELMEAGDS